MAYSMLSRPKMHNSRISYYPEHEYPVDQNYHFHDFERHREDEISISTISKAQSRGRQRRGTSVKCQVSTEKKCPIYVHKFDSDTDPNFSTVSPFHKVSKYLCALQSVEEEPNMSSKVGKHQYLHQVDRKGEKAQKSVISKLEESYWANWKPSRATQIKEFVQRSERTTQRNSKSKGHSGKKRSKTKKQTEYNDNAETMIEVYTATAPSVIKHFSSAHYKEDPSSQSLSDPAPPIPTQRSVGSREIQTECYVKDAETLSKDYEEQFSNKSSQAIDIKTATTETEGDKFPKKERIESIEEVEEIESEINEENSEEILYSEPLDEEKIEELYEKQDFEEPVKDESNDSIQQLVEEDERLNSLKHTDSFILTKKKQSEEKNHYQQPKCIRLYKRPLSVTTTTSFIKGGTYPLKSCLKKESSYYGKRNIRLGRPGSPLIVTSNCYNTFPKTFRK